MFFGYPVAATAENWLHECLTEIVSTIHASLDAANDPPLWPEIIPAAHRERLQSRHGLRDRLTAYTQAARGLDVASRRRVLNSLTEQNEIANLVAGLSECDCIDDLPAGMQEPVANLFTFAFELLTGLGVRDRHYFAIYSATKYRVCPFCGSEYFDAPGAPREDLDHYLVKTRYPFAAANLRNLVPMGSKCNSRYKLIQDILRDDLGHRRTAFDPYGAHAITLTVLHSEPFGGENEQTPAWEIEFVPDSAECATWDTVFRLRERIGRDVLNSSYHQWLHGFAAWFVKRRSHLPLTDALICEALRDYAEDAELTGFTAREFLRGPLFRMLHRHCDQGNRRLIDLIRDLVTIGVPQAA